MKIFNFHMKISMMNFSQTTVCKFSQIVPHLSQEVGASKTGTVVPRLSGPRLSSP